MTTAQKAPFITADKLARRWSVHRDTVYKMPTADLPYMKLGPNTRRYRMEDVEAYEQSRVVGEVPEATEDA